MKKTYLWTAMLCTAIAFSACKSNKAGQDTASEAKTEEAVIPEVIKTNTVASALPDTYGVK